MAMLIVDEPPSRRMTIHPLKEVDDFIFGQMVRENRAYDGVGASVRSSEKILEVSYLMGASRGVKFFGDFCDQGLRSMPVISTLRPHGLAHFDIYGAYRRQRPLQKSSLTRCSVIDACRAIPANYEMPLGGKWASFTRAAAKLGMSSTALSHSMHGLEGTTGLRLLNLTARRVRRLLANACSATRSPD